MWCSKCGGTVFSHCTTEHPGCVYGTVMGMYIRACIFFQDEKERGGLSNSEYAEALNKIAAKCTEISNTLKLAPIVADKTMRVVSEGPFRYIEPWHVLSPTGPEKCMYCGKQFPWSDTDICPSLPALKK